MSATNEAMRETLRQIETSEANAQPLRKVERR